MTSTLVLTFGRSGRVLSTFALAIAIQLSTLSLAAALTPQEEHGRQIYHEGSSPTGAPIYALVGRSGVKVPAGVLVCASCHGEDGLGRPEGGVEPSNITWSYLTTSYGHRHDNGRGHAAFDEASLVTAITERVDPAGNELDRAMPGYEMSPRDLAALIAYLKHLEADLDPGLTETSITVGSLLPEEGPFGPMGRAAEATLRAYFDEINAGGGIYGRRLELVVADYRGDRTATAANARRLVEGDGAFALLAAFALGMEGELFRIFEEAGVPLVGPFTLFAGHRAFESDSTFFVEPGLPDQARALVDYAALELKLAPLAVGIVLSEDAIFDGIAEAIRSRGEGRGWPAPRVVRLAKGPAVAAQVAELKRAGVEALFYFGTNDSLAVFTAEAARVGWTPHLFLSGVFSGRAAFAPPPAFERRLFVAYPNLSSDRTAGGMRELGDLREKYGLPRGHQATQVSVYIAAKIFVEGLRRAGLALSRAELVAALDGLSGFETGLSPPVSYGPNRRVGTLGAHVLAVDLKGQRFHPGAKWVRLD